MLKGKFFGATNYLESLSNNLLNSKGYCVTKNTVTGDKVTGQALEKISSMLKFLPDEKLELLWSYNCVFEYKDNTVVGLTNHRIFKLGVSDIL